MCFFLGAKCNSVCCDDEIWRPWLPENSRIYRIDRSVFWLPQWCVVERQKTWSKGLCVNNWWKIRRKYFFPQFILNQITFNIAALITVPGADIPKLPGELEKAGGQQEKWRFENLGMQQAVLESSNIWWDQNHRFNRLIIFFPMFEASHNYD